ncbi:hypothetical protein LG288_02835 [Idiomarina seosinensis]|uniref:hypothetical protein n=1 Tax=Idiomarina seosinensis TaxID=281739 RepID=UPI00384ABEFD
MKSISIVTLAVSSLMVASACAQELPVPQPQKDEQASAFTGGERDYKTYQFINEPKPADDTNLADRSGERLLAGTEMVNTLSGKEAFVSGVVSVLTEGANADELAQQFGLTVERVYGRLNLVLLRAPEGTDMLQLRRDMMDYTGVSNVDVEIVEALRESDVLR